MNQLNFEFGPGRYVAAKGEDDEPIVVAYTFGTVPPGEDTGGVGLVTLSLRVGPSGDVSTDYSKRQTTDLAMEIAVLVGVTRHDGEAFSEGEMISVPAGAELRSNSAHGTVCMAVYPARVNGPNGAELRAAADDHAVLTAWCKRMHEFVSFKGDDHLGNTSPSYMAMKLSLLIERCKATAN